MAPRTPLVRPRRYFERADRPSLVIATLAVLVLAGATAGVVFLMLPPLVEQIAAGVDMRPEIRAEVVPLIKASVRSEAAVIAGLTVGSWLLYAILLWLAVRVVTGDGDLRATIGVVGEATLALVALFPLKLLALWLFVTTTTDPIANAPLGIFTVYWGTLPLLVLSVLGLAWKIGVVVGGLIAVDDIDWRSAVAGAAVFAAMSSPIALILGYYAVHIYLI